MKYSPPIDGIPIICLVMSHGQVMLCHVNSHMLDDFFLETPNFLIHVMSIKIYHVVGKLHS